MPARGSAAAGSSVLDVGASASPKAGRLCPRLAPPPAAGPQSTNRRAEVGHRAGPRLDGSRRRALFTARTRAGWPVQSLLAAGLFCAHPLLVAFARGGGARGRPPGSARGRERVLGSLGPAPCSGSRPATDGARARARRAPGVVVQPRLAPGATGARGVNGSPLQLHLHLAAAGALRHGRTAH